MKMQDRCQVTPDKTTVEGPFPLVGINQMGVDICRPYDHRFAAPTDLLAHELPWMS